MLFFLLVSANPLAASDKVKLGVAKDGWAPFELVENGQPTGYLVDYLELIAAEAYVQLEWDIVEDRTALVEAATTGKHQVLTYGAKVDKYLSSFTFGPELSPRYIGAFTRTESDVKWSNEVNRAQLIIASPKNWYITDYIARQYPDIRLLITNSAKESLTSVAIGNADITFVDIAVGRYIQQQELLPNIKSNAAPAEIVEQFKPVHLLYGKELSPAVIERIELAVKNVSSQAVNKLHRKWFDAPNTYENELSLTIEERKWLASAPTIRVSAYQNIPPYSYQKNGHIIGFSIDYMRMLAKKLGVKVEFVYDKPWNDLLLSAEEKQIDVLQFVRYREEIDRYMDFSFAYFEGSPSLLYGRNNADKVDSLSKLGDARVAVLRGYAEQVYISDNLRQVRLNIVDSVGDGINQVLRGDSDYFICDPVTCETYLYKNFISNISIKGGLGVPELDRSKNARLAVREDWPLLLSSFNKAIAVVSRGELNQLRKKWFLESNIRREPANTLSVNERQWLEANPRLAFSSPLKAAPFGYFDPKGELGGVARDIVETFRATYDANVHLEKFDTWSETYEALRMGRIDFIPSMSITPERKKHLLFTNPTHVLTYNIHTRLGNRIYNKISELAGEHVGVVKGSAAAEYFEQNYPQITLIEYPHIQDVLVALSTGDIDALLEIPLIADYHIQVLGINNIKVAGETNYTVSVGIGVHPSKPELVSVLNRVIASIGSEQIELLTEKWSNVRVIEKDEWKFALYWSLGGAFLVLTFVLLIAYFNRRSALRVIRETSKQLEEAQRVAQLGSWQIDGENCMRDLSPQACAILNVAKGKDISRIDYIQMVDVRDREQYLAAWSKGLETGLVNVEYRLNLVKESKWVNEVAELQFTEQGLLKSGSAILQDISLFKANQKVLIDQQGELRSLTTKLLGVQEEERKRVARELHDDLSQRLAVLSIDVGTLELNVEDEEVKNGLRRVKRGLVGIAEDTHGLSRRLHPSILDDLGLIEALKTEIETYQQREEIVVEFFCSAKSIQLAKEAELAIFRIVQEALRNVAKYSEASHVQINLTATSDAMIVQIADDGMGFDVDEAKKSPGLGLQSMMERSRLVGGELRIDSKENNGTTIELHLKANQENELS